MQQIRHLRCIVHKLMDRIAEVWLKGECWFEESHHWSYSIAGLIWEWIQPEIDAGCWIVLIARYHFAKTKLFNDDIIKMFYQAISDYSIFQIGVEILKLIVYASID